MLDIGGLFSGVGSVISGGINAIMQQEAIDKSQRVNDKALKQQKEIADQNLEFQKEQYDYQKLLNLRTMNREDDAVQRRVADLKAAGLNPVLAAGSSASSQSFRAGTAPQLDSSYFGSWAQRSIENARMGIDARMGLANFILDLVRQRADISRSEAETALLNERAQTMRQERPLNLENMTLANSFLKQSFDVRLDQKYADLSATQKENLIRDKKSLLLDKQVDYEDVRYLMGYADYLLKGKSMDKLDKELLVMDSLIKARDMEYQINEWNLKYFKDRNLPTSYRDPAQIKLVKEILGGGLNDDIAGFFESLFNDLPQDVRDNIQKNLDSYKAKNGKPFRNFVPTKNNMKYVGKSGYQS